METFVVIDFFLQKHVKDVILSTSYITNRIAIMAIFVV